MKWALGCLLVLLFTVALAGNAQSQPSPQTDAKRTQEIGYWMDPDTGLMWTARDNSKDVSWEGAVKYCQNLRTGGYTDWRLPTLDELNGIYDKTAESPGRAGKRAYTWHVKGNLSLTGYPWSSEQRLDDRGRPSGYAWYFNFTNGRALNDPSGFPYSSSFMRALCVRSIFK